MFLLTYENKQANEEKELKKGKNYLTRTGFTNSTRIGFTNSTRIGFTDLTQTGFINSTRIDYSKNMPSILKMSYIPEQ